MTADVAGSGEPSTAVPRARALLRRWPSTVAVGLCLLSWGVDVELFGQLLVLLPMMYVVMLVLPRRANWPLLLVASTAFVGLQEQDVVDARLVVFVVAAGALAVAALGHGATRRQVVVQAAGMAAFGAVAVVGLTLAPGPAGYVIAAGWLLHAAWDAAHLGSGAVVSRSYAEWCLVVDLLVGAQLLLLA
jgi:hypothetical protein